VPDEQKGPIEVNLAHLSESLTDWGKGLTEPFQKEKYARSLAQWIVRGSIFTLAGVIVIGYTLIFRSASNPENAKQIIQGAVVPLLEKAATFFTTVFSPLLAFILGYYFGERQAQRRKND
jgi:hypothetical protein